MYDPIRFGEKYQLAVEAAQKEYPHSGLCGFELEWNLVDDQFRPLLRVGSGLGGQSFVDFFREELLPGWVKDYSQLEVFHWMIEWATRPYCLPRGAVYEARILEGVMQNALSKAARQFETNLYAWHGNLLYVTRINHDSIPSSWHLAKRRYLERCVDLYGESLATAGIHVNLSLPEPLMAWDFMHLSPTERSDLQFDDYKNHVYITATRILRGFAALFIACSASTPLKAQLMDDQSVVLLTDIDSVRNLTFPNPKTIDLPDLYRSYQDYLQISYDLVRRGVRFGNNNWTPVRARSFAEPVERLIAVTSEQLEEIYARGLYALNAAPSLEEMASKIEMQNLMARINLPMSRVEVRTDDGFHPLEIDIANLTMKQLLLLRIYADPFFGRSFRYDQEDISRARRNEEMAARFGLEAEIENPFSGKPFSMREFLRWTLSELKPLADVLGVWDDLEPLIQMANGAPNTAERIRRRLRAEIESDNIVPVELLKNLACERIDQIAHDLELVAEPDSIFGRDALKISEFLQKARDSIHADPEAPVRFLPRVRSLIEISHPDVSSEVLGLAQELIRIPSVTACPNERLDEVRRVATLIFDYARNCGLGVRYYYREKYPALLIGFPGQMQAKVMLSGHFDVVEPDPDDSQFEPRIEGDYLWGRGAADMKTVVATYLVWMKNVLLSGAPYPPINLLLVGNEENGESEPMGTPHVLSLLREDENYQPEFFIAGERTGEGGNELFGEVCIENRGVMRFDVIAQGQRGHTGVSVLPVDLTERVLRAQAEINSILGHHLTLYSLDGWQSQVKYPFIQVGTPGIYNISSEMGIIGVEVRPIPQDDLEELVSELQAYCRSEGLILDLKVCENGIACSPSNPYLVALLDTLRHISGNEPVLGRKLPGTSARFAPGGEGIVWGQSGILPHSKDERHYIPSIKPYYLALWEFGQRLAKGDVPDIYLNQKR